MQDQKVLTDKFLSSLVQETISVWDVITSGEAQIKKNVLCNDRVVSSSQRHWAFVRGKNNK